MDICKSTKNRAFLVAAALVLAGCGQGDFNYGKVTNIIQGSPQRLDAEYVVLTQQQVDCGIHEDLWDTPIESGDHRLAHLTEKARDLKFADDVSIGDMKSAYAQIRGDFNLAVLDLTSDKEGPEPNTKLVQAKLGVTVSHSCFPDPLPLMGIRKGNFSQDASPVLLFRYNNGWRLEHLVH